jgi:RNA polymerase sigma-70 factor, ECF subfamily
MITDRQREACFKDWLNEHRGIFYRIARAYAWTPEDQADLFQEMAAQLWRSLPGFKAQCQPVTWVYRVCLNTALGWRRDSARQPAFATLDRERIDLAPAVEPRPGWTYENDELLARLYAHIRELPAGERSLVLLSLDGLSYREIGDLAGLTENHVGVALNRARQKLAAYFKEVRDEL